MELTPAQYDGKPKPCPFSGATWRRPICKCSTPFFT